MHHRIRFHHLHRTMVAPLAIALSASFALTSAGIAHASVPTDVATHASSVQQAVDLTKAAAVATNPGTFVSLEPARILDTRIGNGAPQIPVAAYDTVSLQVTSRGGVPSTGVAAVVMNVTATAPTAGGFVTVYPSGSNMPTASNLNFAAGQTIPNLVTVKVGPDGRVNLSNWSAGTAHLIADVSGYYLAGTPSVSGAFVGVDPSRVLDTRLGNGAPQAPVAPSHSAEVQVTGRGGVPPTGVSAVVVNVTVTAPATAGFITVFPYGGVMPTASNLNFTAGQNVPNLVTVKVGVGGKISLANNSAGTVDLIADVAGYYLDAGSVITPGAFVSLAPSRVLDTRIGIGAGERPVDESSGVSLQVAERGGVPAQGVAAVVMNVTASNPQAGGFITVYPNGYTEPTASNLNFSAGQNIPNLAVVKVGGNGSVNLINNSAGTVDLIADVAGYFIASHEVPGEVWPSGWIFDDCGTDWDAVVVLANPGIMYSPGGGMIYFEGQNYYEIFPDASGQLVLTVSAEAGFELVNPDATQWVTNANGTLTGTFTFTNDPCHTAMRTSPDNASPYSPAPATDSVTRRLDADPLLGANE